MTHLMNTHHFDGWFSQFTYP